MKSSFLPSISNTTHLCSRSQHHFHVIALSVELSWVGWQGCWTLPCQLNVQAFLETREQYYLKDSNKQQHWLLTSRLRTFHARSMWKGAGEYFATSFNAPPCDIVSPYYWTHRLIPSAPSDPQCFPLCMLRVSSKTVCSQHVPFTLSLWWEKTKAKGQRQEKSASSL